MAVVIRRATVSDLPWLRHLYKQLCESGKVAYPSSYPTLDEAEYDEFVRIIYRHLTENPDFHCYVADDDGPVVGFLAGELLLRAIGRPHLYASPHYLYIEPTARKRGIARALIAAGTTMLAEKGVTHVELAALAGDDNWGRRGFTPYLTKYWATVADIQQLGVLDKVNGKPVEPPEPKRKRGRPRKHPPQVEA